MPMHIQGPKEELAVLTEKELSIYATSIALDELKIKGVITEAQQDAIVQRADELLKALYENKVLEPMPDGTYSISDRDMNDVLAEFKAAETLEVGE